MARWLLALLLSSGCGFGLSGPNPDRPRHLQPACSTSKGLVVLDWVTAGVAATIATGLLGTDQPSLALIPGAIGALYIAGAISGNASVNACRQAREEFELVHHDVLPPADDDHPNLAPPGIAPSPPAPASVAQAATPPPQPAQPSSPQVAPPQRPAPQPPPQPQQPPDLTKQLTKQPAPEPNADEWPDFWREVSP